MYKNPYEIRLCYLISVSLEIRFRRIQITACSYYTQGLGHSLGQGSEFSIPNAKRPHDRKIDFLSCGLEKQRMERLFTPPDFSLVSSLQRGSTASFFLSYPCASVSYQRFLNGSCIKDTLIESQNSIESAFPLLYHGFHFGKYPFPHFSSC